MPYLSTALRFLFYSNIWIALAAVSLTAYTLLLKQEPIDGLVLLLIFLATLTTYNLCVFYSNTDYTEKFSFIKRWRIWLMQIFLGGLLSLFFISIFLHLTQLIFLVHLAIISFFYTVPISVHLPSGRLFFIPAWRNLPYLKIFLIAYVWASATVIFPLLKADLFLTQKDTLLLFAERFCFIFAITLPFDLRDYFHDRQAQLITFAQRLSHTGLKFLSLIVLVLALIFSSQQAVYLHFYIQLGITATATLLIYKAHTYRPDWYFTGLIDGILLLPIVAGWIFLD
ncbi:MAG: hypothetical protein JJT94_07545 [Bernardetiaceae bacterium]|nr:hypothetical protein [Bernardetiaceae bacterium]